MMTQNPIMNKALFPLSPIDETILKLCDVIVDGKFVQDLYDITLRFRGSSNQRIIDVKQSIKENKVVLWEGDSVFATHSM